ncbi:glycosyltransferase [Shewanella profunda]|uniref:glycosyltransferase n=1 Tax=Shewanella profunda TaxID=254793 RepID=UPI0013554E3F|nr:glycosyltransferase [Shewanella profunda]MCL1091877.1 glycosyltransferase [Shewanella profunda]CAD6364620.1 Undecaprenyl-phosphate 4-deoxy-4-formamido-L-arabinose transferase [Shewanella hafniensis]
MTKMQPIISIIIPIYKVERFLERCLNSVLAQTYNDFEVICINDGSPDNCDLILAEYEKNDNRIKVINQVNQGPSVARNAGLSSARGDYVYFIDPDDAIQPQTLEIAFLLAKKHQADLVVWQRVYSNGLGKPDKIFDLKKIDAVIITDPLYHKSKRHNKIGSVVWNKLYKRELLKDIFFIPGIHYEDISFSFSVIAKRPKTVIIPTPLYLYTKFEESITQQKPTLKIINDYHIAIDSIYETYKKSMGSKELKHIKNNLMRPLLSYQFKKCKQADQEQRAAMLQAFAEELRDLDAKGLLTWRGHRIYLYIAYKKLMRTARL